MAHYRVYVLHTSGRITAAFDFDCPDDREALEQAAAACADDPVEVWCGARRIGHVHSHAMGVGERPLDD